MAVAGGSASPPFSPLLVLPSSRPPCEKISFLRGGLDSPQKLRRLGLQIGSPKMYESFVAAFLQKMPSLGLLCTGEGFGASSRE